MGVISTNELAAIRRRERKLLIYRWQTKGFFTAQRIWARYYLPRER